MDIFGGRDDATHNVVFSNILSRQWLLRYNLLEVDSEDIAGGVTAHRQTRDNEEGSVITSQTLIMLVHSRGAV